MAFNYRIRILDRTNESSYVEFVKGVDIAEWDFEKMRRGGCGAFKATLALDDWSTGSPSPEDFMCSENIVQIWLDINVGSFGTHPDYTGFITKVDKEKATPPKRVVRTIQGYGLSKQIGRNGYLVLYATNGATIYAVVGDLLALFAANTDIISSPLQIQTGWNYTLGRVLYYPDKPGLDCIRQLAEVNLATVYGVDARRRLYFKPETDTGAPSIITVRLGDKDDGIKSFTHTETSPGPNLYIVEGQHALSGNPMTIEESDIEAGGRTRPKRKKAPELIVGANLIRWAQFLLARDRDPKTRIKLPRESIDSDGMAQYVIDPNNNAAIQDENGALITTEQIQAVQYRMKGGNLGMTLELGTDPELDLLGDLELREMLREIRVHQAKELSNQTEIAADASGWATDALVEFVMNYQMRNCVRFTVDNDRTLIDWDHDETVNIGIEETLGGVTANLGGTGHGTLVTLPIEVGRVYNEFSMYRRIVYPRLIATDPAAFVAKSQFYAGSGGTIKFEVNNDGDGIQPHWLGALSSFEGYAIWPRPVALFCHHIVTMKWGHPIGSSTYAKRYYIFQFKDTLNHARIAMWRTTASTMTWALYKTVDGNSTPGFTHTMAVDDQDILELTVDMRSASGDWINLNPICTLRNVTQSITNGPWDGGAHFLLDLVNLGAYKVGFRAWHVRQSGLDEDDWHVQLLTFDQVMESGYFWKISRDGGESWEPSEGGWSPDTVDLIDLGDYAGPGTAGEEVLVRGGLSYPQTMTHWALAWKNS